MGRKSLVIAAAAAVLALTISFAAGCSSGGGEEPAAQRSTDISSELVYDHSMELDYATGFQIDYYNDGYKLITIADEGDFLVVPEGKEAPADISEETVILQQPLDRIYLVASSAMDMFRAVDGIDNIRLSGTKQNDWYIDEAVQAMKDGAILYAGKYNMPDYELIVTEGCDLAIESTMIYHTPEVKEALESRGIPVLVERSSYEEEPLGRSEWVKLYGALLNEEDLAKEAFDGQKAILDEVVASAGSISEPKTMAYFFITSAGAVSARKSDDYIPKMIELAGGKYIFEDLGDDSTSASTVKLQMEEFYAGAQAADYLIYNSTIDGEVETVDSLIGKSELLGKFEAVKAGNVWCTSESMYQKSMSLANFISDIHKIVLDPNTPDEELTFLFKLK